EVRALCKEFPLRAGLLQRPVGIVRAVDNVSFDLLPGETLGLVGESGCGKTTLGKALLRLIEPTSGSITLRVGHHGSRQAYDLLKLGPRPLRQLRKHMQIVFQNPYAALNPRLAIGTSMAEGIRALSIHSRSACRDRIAGLLQRVGQDKDAVEKYP